MSLSVMFDKNILNRYVCAISFKDDRIINCIIDSACSTTLVPLTYARRYGKKLNHTADVTVAGNTMREEDELYVVINNVR